MWIFALLPIALISCQQAKDTAEQSTVNGIETSDALEKNTAEDEDEAPGTGLAKTKGYVPRLGDTTLTESVSKSWQSNAAEPNFGPALESTKEVTGVYRSETGCVYRARTEESGQSVERDYGCKPHEALQCSYNEGESSCSSGSIEDKDIGEFKAARGEQKTCVSLTSRGGQTTVTKTTTREWKHRKAFAIDLTVKRTVHSCTVVVNDSRADEIKDACEPPDGVISTINRTRWTIVEQIRGPGGVHYTKAPNVHLETETQKMQTTAHGDISCAVNENKLRVAVQSSACLDDKPASLTWSISDLPTEEFIGSSLQPRQLVMSYNGQPRDVTDHSCTTTVRKDKFNAMLHGEIECQNRYPIGASSVTLKKIVFSCMAPEGYPEFDRDPDMPFAGKRSPAREDPVTGEIILGTNPDQSAATTGNSSTNGSDTNGGGLEATANGQIIFLSSYTEDGNMTFEGKKGRSGADARCTFAAQNSTLGLPGRYRAVLSNVASDLKDHIGIVGQVYNVKGELVAENRAEFFGTLRAKISYDEHGTDHGAAHVHTGSRADGTHHYKKSCYHWQRHRTLVTRTQWGVANALDAASRFSTGIDKCTKQAHVWCIQQP